MILESITTSETQTSQPCKVTRRMEYGAVVQEHTLSAIGTAVVKHRRRCESQAMRQRSIQFEEGEGNLSSNMQKTY